MSWVRYDDGFDCHPKVTAVIAEDAGAVALHVLANTWAARQKRPDFVPSHQPGLLVGSKTRGAKWAGLLERHGLWNAVDGGWEFHDHARLHRNHRSALLGTLRAYIYERDGHRCKACGDTVGPFAIDHIMPLILGGSFNDPENLQVLCRTCNRDKWTSHPDEWTRR